MASQNQQWKPSTLDGTSPTRLSLKKFASGKQAALKKQFSRLLGASMRNKLDKELQTASRESGSRKNPTSADYSKGKRGGSRQQLLLKKQPRKSQANQYLHPLRVPLTPETRLAAYLLEHLSSAPSEL